MKNELSIPPETRVALDVSEANRLHRYAQTQAEMAEAAGRNAVMAGLKLGKLLVELKAATDRGEWGQLFKDKRDTKLNTCVQFETQANVNHGLHLNFTRQMANRYMRCYKSARTRLAASEADQMDALLRDSTMPTVLTDIVAKATDGAETPRQMMLNLGVIATRKRTAHGVRHVGFTDSGNPDGPTALTPMDKLANDLAALHPNDEERERRQHQAEQDAAALLKQLGTYVDQGYVNLLRPQERELFAEALATYSRKVSDIDEQRIKATMEGIVNGTTTL